MKSKQDGILFKHYMQQMAMNERLNTDAPTKFFDP